MQTYKQVVVVVTLVLVAISFNGCDHNPQMANKEINKQMQEEIQSLKSELNVLKDELAKKEREYQTLLNESRNKEEEEILDLSYISINKNKVNRNVINEFGLNLNLFCEEVWAEMDIEILEYSKKEFGGGMGVKVPTKFKVSLNNKCVEFEGVVYASAVNGDPTAEYIAGKFGYIRARYRKSNIILNDKTSISRLFDQLGIVHTFYDDKSIDIHRIEE